MQTIPIACSLDRSELSDRARLMKDLGRNLVAVEADGLSASLRFDADRARVEEFIRAESRCCPFFDLELRSEAGVSTLHVGAPEGGEWAVRGLVAGFVDGWSGLV
jgi:hypothetical protein